MMRPCLACGVPSRRGGDCPNGCTARKASDRGYDSTWRRLARTAIAAQPWCSDCGHGGSAGNPLTGDHLVWPAESLADVAVVCRSCNSRRGPTRFTRPT